VGKTTTAAVLAERAARAVHLEADAFFRFIRSGQIEPWELESHQQNAVVMQIVAEAAAGYATAGYFTIVDGIVIPGWFLEPLRDTLRTTGHPVAYAVLRAPLPICMARAQSREGEPPIDSEVIEQLWRSFTDLGDLERHVLEVVGRGPEDVADLLEQRLEQGLLSAI
jgi:predicted kinase